MAKPRSIAIFADTPARQSYLTEIVKAAGFIAAAEEAEAGSHSEDIAGILTNLEDIGRFKDQKRPVLWLCPSKSEVFEGVRLLAYPCRAAFVIEALQKMASAQDGGTAQRRIGPWQLNARDNLLESPAGEIVRLTEKETALLVFLEEAGGATVPRQMLLEKVWSYVDGVETHTLETHIYRLRQKIEKDPSLPKIVLTQDDGYSLGVTGE